MRFSPFRWVSSASRKRNIALAAGSILLIALSTRWHVAYGSGVGIQSLSGGLGGLQDPLGDSFGRSPSGATAEVIHRPFNTAPDHLLENEPAPSASSSSASSSSASSSSASSSSSPADLAPAPMEISAKEEALETLAMAYEEERLSHLSSIEYDPSVAEEQIHCPPGSLSPKIDEYISRLESFADTYFAGSPHHAGLLQSLSRMVRAMPAVEGGEFDRVIYSFDKEGPGGTPPEFEGWKERVTGWEVKVGDDQQVEKWFEECTAGNNTAHKQVGELGSETESPTPTPAPATSPWRSLWDGIDRPVIKADMLRYLVMLIKGGMYTDSDTAPLSDPLLWGVNASSIVSPSLLNLQQGIRRLTSPTPSHGVPPSSNLEPGLDPTQSLRGISNPSISVVLSVEYDLDNPLQDPRPGYRRDLQIVQWTFLAKPYHPIFLDVLETAVATIEEYRDQGVKEGWSEVLDITGPGPFTDAVLRYLLVEYGVAPQEIQDLQQAAIIGDVLLLPLHAFGSFLDQWEDKWNLEPGTRCVAHGFRGRWKWDWGMIPARS